MDRQDLQDDRRSDLQFGEVTEKIIRCSFAGDWNRGRPTDPFWQSETRMQTIHPTQVN